MFAFGMLALLAGWLFCPLWWYRIAGEAHSVTYLRVTFYCWVIVAALTFLVVLFKGIRRIADEFEFPSWEPYWLLPTTAYRAALLGALIPLFAVPAGVMTFGVSNGLRVIDQRVRLYQSHNEAIMATVATLRPQCDRARAFPLSESPPTRAKALVWDMVSNKKSDIQDILPADLRVHYGDRQVTVVMILSKHEACFVNWPERTVQGRADISGFNQQAVAEWISGHEIKAELVDAISKRLVSARATGDGIESLTVDITLKALRDLQVTIMAGTLFDATAPGVQTRYLECQGR
jgi:hypothetical protein